MVRIERNDFGVDELSEALTLHNVANTNALVAMIEHLVEKRIFGKEELDSISRAFSKPLDLDGPRENAVVSQLQDQFEEQLAQMASDLARGYS